MSAHRWSGFPGAWCLDCGIECGCELCMADEDNTCGPGDDECKHPERKDGECPEPYSNRHNPYGRNE